MITWCKKCILPSTRPNLVIGKDGVCNACKNHEKKIKIDWTKRKKNLDKILTKIKKNNKSNYDCVLPVSGGKDSTWLAIKALEFGLKPLAVTWKTPFRNSLGNQNLKNLISLGVDHIDWTNNPIIEKKFIYESFKIFGSTAIPMHLSIYNIPLIVASTMKIPIVFFAENSAYEYGYQNHSLDGYKMTKKFAKTFGVNFDTTASYWIKKGFKKKDLINYYALNKSKNKVLRIFLGHFIKWDPKKIYQQVKKHGFKSASKPKTGLYNFADIDDDFISIHHWLKWYKFGFLRKFDNLSLEIRNNRLSRTNALKMISPKDTRPPKADIKKLCNYLGIEDKRFYKLAEKFRNKNIWKKKNKKWFIQNFIKKQWEWNEN
tara:strand:- start:5030 stop:6148 length:1119 start_codon:yes stop_codon:yes gene_type:complete